MAEAVARGVTVARCPVARRDAVVEQAIGHLIALMRRQPALDAHARAGIWARAELPALEPSGLRGQDVLVVGQGVIGRRVTAVLHAFGANVLAVDPAGVAPEATAVAFDDVFPSVAAITLHCALVPTTRELFGPGRIRRLRRDAVLVNTARGALVDVPAAVARVRDGALRGFATDVFAEEPWPGLAEAAAVSGVLVTPHSAGFTRDLGQRVAAEVDAALTAWVAGEPVPHRVTAPG